MTFTRKKAGIAILTLVVLVLAGAFAYVTFRPAVGPGGGAFGPGGQIQAYVSLARAPRLNEPFLIESIFEAMVDETDVEGHVNLPSSAIYLDGDWKYRGPIKKGGRVTLSTKAAIVEGGRWSISAAAEAGEYRKPASGGPAQWKPWYPVHRSFYSLGLEVTAQKASLITSGAPGSARPQPKNFNVKPGDAVPMSIVGTAVGTELLNNSDQQYFLLLHDKAGIQNLRTLGLVPQQLWGPWGPFLSASLTDILHPDFNLNFVVLVIDRKRPTTGYRMFVESAERGPNGEFLNIRVRSEAPPAGVSLTNKQISPYDNVVFNKNDFKQGQTVAVKFFLNGQLQSQQSIVLRRPGQGIISHMDVYPNNYMGKTESLARLGASRMFNVPADNLERISGGPNVDGMARPGVHFYGYNFRDKATGKTYSIVVDVYGRAMEEKDAGRLREANRRAKLALAFDGIEPELYDLLESQKDDYVASVEVWFRPTAPGASYAEAARPLLQAIRSLNVQPVGPATLPVITVNTSKARIKDISKREEVVIIMKSRGN